VQGEAKLVPCRKTSKKRANCKFSSSTATVVVCRGCSLQQGFMNSVLHTGFSLVCKRNTQRSYYKVLIRGLTTRLALKVANSLGAGHVVVQRTATVCTHYA